MVTGGRDLLVDGPSLSMLFLLFIDGFGIFRNIYPSLKGFYLTPASLPYAERRKESNMFTLTLGPHEIKEGTEVPRPESPGLKLKKKSRNVSVASEWIIRSGLQLYSEARNAKPDEAWIKVAGPLL